jgi:hypothetical protein
MVGLLTNAGASVPERGLSQTAARVLARALNLRWGGGWRGAAGWGQLALRKTPAVPLDQEEFCPTPRDEKIHF